jgi:hypothetical protein
MTYHYSRPHSVYAESRPHSVYTESSYQTQQPSSALRPHSVVGYEGFSSSPMRQSSFRVIRRRQQRKNVRNNVLNPTLDNFYKTLRRTEADLNVKSAKNWINEYESYRKQVINAEKSGGNSRPVSCYASTMVSSPTMEYQRYSMHF